MQALIHLVLKPKKLKQNYDSYCNWPLAKLRPQMQTGKSEHRICQLWPGSDTTLHGCVTLKLIKSFQIFVFFRLVLWISSSSWLNVVSGALLKVMLVIRQGSKETCSLPFQTQKFKSVTLCSGHNCPVVLILCWTPHSLTSTANITSTSITLQ